MCKIMSININISYRYTYKNSTYFSIIKIYIYNPILIICMALYFFYRIILAK